MPTILVYALLLVLIVVLIFAAWQLWCAAVVNLVNPILEALNAGTVSPQMCGGASDTLQRLINRIKQLKLPNIDPIDLPISSTLLVQIAIVLALIATLILLGITFNQLIKAIKEDRAKPPVTASPGKLREAVISWTTNLLLWLQRRFVLKQEIEGAAPADEPVDSDDIFFTAIHPKEGAVAHWYTMLVYTHLFSALGAVQDDVERFRDQIASLKETSSKSSTEILRGTEITIIPICENVTFNPSSVRFRWMEDFHRAEFRFIANKFLLDDAAKGQIDIFAGPLIIGSLKFAMLFHDGATSPTADYVEHVKIYSKDDVFISYSRKDKEIARAFKNVLAATGFDVFLDVDDIRTGQYWQPELRRRIERAKIFEIFWSQNYSESDNCRLEWEHALKQNKEEGYIRPVFWKNPLSPKPPEELNRFNFKYVELNLPKM